MMMELSMRVITFLITNTVLRTEVLQGRAQVRENPSSLMGDISDGYWMENAVPIMMVMTQQY